MIVAELDVAAHLAENLREADISLQRVPPKAIDTHPAPGNRRSSKEV